MTKWVPKTKIGKMVEDGEITDLERIHQMNKPILEYQIIDKLLGNMDEEVLDVTRVSRTTDSGRKLSYRVTTAVGDKKGHIGIGTSKGKNVPQAIEKSVKVAKKNMKTIKRGCGSWECGCGEGHSIEKTVEGKVGSVKIKIKPAPRGTGIVAGETARKILQLTGVKDAWTKTKGKTNTTKNFAEATLEALKKTRKTR